MPARLFRSTGLAHVCIFACLLVLTGCASKPGKFTYYTATETHVFPKPPAQPRYRFVGALTGEANFVREKKSGLSARKVFSWIVGLVAGREIPRHFGRPQAGWTDPVTGRIYVTDVARKAVFVFDRAAGFLYRWDAASKKDGFITPLAVTGGPDNTVLVSDAEHSAVIVLDQEGRAIRQIRHATLQRPVGLAFDSAAQEIYVSDSQAHDIKVFTADGTWLRTLGKKGEAVGQFISPTHLALTRRGLLVTDTLNSRVQLLTPQGKWLKTIGKRGMSVGDMPRPKGVAVDAAERVYVVESYHDYLLVYDAEGRFLLPIGGSGGKVGQFYLPAGVWVHERHVFVADTFNARVMVFEYIGDKPADNKS